MAIQEHTTAWLMYTRKYNGCNKGDRMGILLDLDDGSLRFFRNGVEHGPGYPAGSVTGPVARATQMSVEGNAVRLLPDAVWPAGHTP